MTRLTVLALLLTVVQGAWAQTGVSTEAALKEALDNNQSVKLNGDIQLSSHLVIEDGKNITIDLNGMKLSRKLTSAVADGNVIRVETGGTLTIKDASGYDYGRISGGKATNGGGIVNHGTLTIEGGTVTDCSATDCGGGIFNAPATAGGTPATLTIKGGQVTTNDCGDRGAGIFNYPGCTINMQGEVFIRENMKNRAQNNLYLDGDDVINVTGSLNGSVIGVTIPQDRRTITSGFQANNPSASVSALFRSDKDNYSFNIVNGEVRLSTVKEVFETVTCIERSWDAEKKEVIAKQRVVDCIPLTGKNDDWQSLGEKGTTTWYCVKEDVQRRAIVINGEVHIVMYNRKFNLNHIRLEAKSDAKLHIHSVDGRETGLINVIKWYTSKSGTSYSYYEEAAAIGGEEGESMGTLVVHGSKIFADLLDLHAKVRNVESSATIGGGYKGGGGTLIVYAGRVTADGNKADNGGGSISVHGGPGIGAGYKGEGGDVHIYGGVVESFANANCSAIGGSLEGYYSSIEFAPNMRVTAGTVKQKTIFHEYETEAVYDKTDIERVFTTAEREAACHYRTYALVEPCDHKAQNGDQLDDQISAIDEFTHGTPCRYCAGYRNHEGHQVPTGSSSKCPACGRDANDICFYLHDNDEKTPERIATLSKRSQWSVMLKDHTFYHDGNWNTLVLPFELASFDGTPLEGATVERIKDATLSADGVLTINMEEVKAILSADGTVGQPLFVKWPQGDDVTSPRFNSVTFSNRENPRAFTGFSFQPLYQPLSITADNIDNVVFLGSDNQLGYSDAPRQLRAFHGYFQFDSVAGSRAMTRTIINHGDGTTGVITPKVGTPMTVDEFWYDLTGRRFEGQPTEKGLYIHQGKKIIIK